LDHCFVYHTNAIEAILSNPAELDTCVPEVLDEITQKVKRGMHQVVAERSVLKGMTVRQDKGVCEVFLYK